MNTTKDTRKNYLVFERDQPPHPGGAWNTEGQPISTPVRQPSVILLGYKCIGAVRAKDPESAVQAVVKATRRVEAYAVLEATFLDFTRDDASAVEAETPLLNP